MSVISVDFFQLIQGKIATIRGVSMVGLVTPDVWLVQNRSVLIFSLEVLLETHRKKYASVYRQLTGKLALDHLLLKKYKWSLKEIRDLSLSDSILALHEELMYENLPEEAKKIINLCGAHTSKKSFTEINNDDWDPELYLIIPESQNW